MQSDRILHVALPLPLYQNFDYLAPMDAGRQKIEAGVRARVSFGNRMLTGVVVGSSTHSDLAENKLKSVSELLDSEPVFDTNLLQLLFWAAEYYQQPLGEVLNTALPGLLRKGKYTQANTQSVYQLGNQVVAEGTFKRAPKQNKIYALLLQHPKGLTADELNEKLSHWRIAMRALLDKNYIKKIQQEKYTQLEQKSFDNNFLNQEQKDAHSEITKQLDAFNPFLLDGVTGSGKTEVYLATANDVLKNNKQVLILVPEIGLTPQIVQRIESRLGVDVVLTHSNLNETKRAQTWLAAKTGKAKIIVGTRSAVFLSFKNLGLIIVDEEHDLSFKQHEGFLYHARDVAMYRAKQISIPIILGSATPSLESQHNVTLGRYKKLILSQRAKKSKLPLVKLIDLRAKLISDGLSNELTQAIEKELAKNHQVLLFLNRRGFAPVILCQDCSWAAECSRCDARMTYYAKQNLIKCHHCFQQQATPELCASCGSKNLLFLGEGTQRVENKLKELFPNSKITRIDRDSTRKKDSLDEKLDAIHAGECQIIIGTQMLSKGHDFPGVTLVGVLNVDQGLFSSDFRATERLAQLLIQVAGRAGRTSKQGKVLIQTYQPEHPLLNCLLSQGYNEFSKQVLALRKSCALPPYTHMVLVRARAHQQNFSQQFLASIKNSIAQNNIGNLNILGPIPSLIERKAGMYQNQLIIIASNRGLIQQQLNTWTQLIQQLPLAKRVRWDIEVDPLEME